jgi:hypothetical protein
LAIEEEPVIVAVLDTVALRSRGWSGLLTLQICGGTVHLSISKCT